MWNGRPEVLTLRKCSFLIVDMLMIVSSFFMYKNCRFSIIFMILITYVTLCSNPYIKYPPFPLYSLTSSLLFS